MNVSILLINILTYSPHIFISTYLLIYTRMLRPVSTAESSVRLGVTACHQEMTFCH